MKTQIAKLNYLRMAPRKVRLIASSLKGLAVNEAEAHLLISPKKAGEPLLKLLRSAISNSKQKELKTENLFIKEIRVDQGPMLKRYMPRAQGRATPIQKKTSHIILVLAESEKIKGPRFKIEKVKRIKGKEEKNIENKEKGEEKTKSAEETKKPVEKHGFSKRIFRRKSV
ncbi:50S ribosomal protein L22 [Candidatus Wolfebacteria bacterium RIFCSPLOWO2_01_FULL_38_11]|uniref:Large ribosomal subunit protein uL22 n=2 Tax=Candidatus Wolfeibacteriota TaxID=1752735 RepID=A0A0G0GB87_9BACT|nr:MAG: 50S ribosomal protein L22, large subunit ribosomal protein L22 [Candidatus Wolfebacteria bacterium GW2011_GWC1_37_10]OGM91357.1 MAG: 50S ribosomal protein L22 [Candidatus Wolfebacteria bacterium RIFCSPLOWO2_01_FULL_38_11]